MRAVETGSSVGSSYVDALAYAVSSCVTEPAWCRGCVMVPGSQPAPPRFVPRCLAVPQSNTVAESAMGARIRGWGAQPELGAHRHSGTDPRNSQRARRVAPACEGVSEDHLTRSKTARGAIPDPDFHLPHENKNVLSPGRGVPIAPMVRRKTAEHEVGTRLKRNVVALLGRQREIFKMGLAVVARIYPYDHARAPSHREIIGVARPRATQHPGTATVLQPKPIPFESSWLAYMAEADALLHRPHQERPERRRAALAHQVDRPGQTRRPARGSGGPDVVFDIREPQAVGAADPHA